VTQALARERVPAGPPDPAPAVRKGRTRAVLQWLLPVLVSGGVLAYLFAAHAVDPRAIGSVIAAVSPPGVLLFLLVSLVGLGLRTLRYWVLLERRAPIGALALVTLVRNLFVDLVPARAGAAVSYLYLVTARLGVPAEAAVASFALAFVLDTLTLGPFLLVALLVVGVAPLSPALLIGGSLAVFVGASAALVLLAPALRVAARAAGHLPGRLARVATPLAGAAAEVGRLAARRVLGPALVLSVLLRLAKYGAYYCLLEALLVGQGHASDGLGFARVFLSLAGAEMAASLPLPAIASLGPYEAAGALGFSYWLGLPAELAILAAAAFHGLSQLHDYSLGLLALLWIMAPWGRWTGRPRTVR
jgi:hypothetical protein